MKSLQRANIPALRMQRKPPPLFWTPEQRPLFLFLLVASGIAYPLTFLPVKYEALILATVPLIALVQLFRGKLRPAPLLGLVAGIVIGLLIFQVLKILILDITPDVRHFFRANYGLIIFTVAIAVFSNGFGKPEEMARTANAVLLPLGVLVIISAIIGVRLFATGFAPEFDAENVAAELYSGNYRFITYFNPMIVFLLFYNMAVLHRAYSRKRGICATIALILVLLTASRSLIAPVVAILAVQLLLSGRLGKAAAVAVIALGAFAILIVVAPRITSALITRFEVQNLIDTWRETEQLLAWKKFQSAPIFGIPVGTPYTHYMSFLAGDGDFARNADYDIHNEYLWFLLYFGLIGTAIVATLVMLVTLHVLKVSQRTPHGEAFIYYVIFALVPMYYSTILMRGLGAMWFGFMVALCVSNSGLASRVVGNSGISSRFFGA